MKKHEETATLEASSSLTCSAAGPRCHCGSTNTVATGFCGYQAPDASKGDPGAEGDEYGCNDCGRCFTW